MRQRIFDIRVGEKVKPVIADNYVHKSNFFDLGALVIANLENE